MGTYVFNGASWLIISPPLIVTKEEIDQGVDNLDKALELTDNEFVK